jgi:hypothetical protein
MTFDYELPAELFTAKRKRGARSGLGYRRFATAAEAWCAPRLTGQVAGCAKH